MPPDARYVGRPTRWGNPFRVGADIPTEYHDYFQSIHGLWRGVKVVDRQYAVDLFTVWLLGYAPYTASELRRELGGRDLVCWCPIGEPCHADLLLQLANGEPPW